jgi:protein-glutamine gamma-glutamyltransferase
VTALDNASLTMPRFWLAVALIAWGALTDNLPGACVMALLLEGVTLAPIKWTLGAREFHRAADLTSIVFAAVAAIQFSRYAVHGIYQILPIIPYCFFPLILAQRASIAQSIPLSALFYSLRRSEAPVERIDLAPHYLVICLVASSTTARGGWWFIVVCALLLVVPLGLARPRRYRRTACALAFSAALALGLIAQYGVVYGQRALEGSMLYWFNQFPWSGFDANTAVTAIGALGRLKLSDQIRVRVTPSRALALPLFLQEASFDRFNYGNWKATDAPFAAVDKIGNQQDWEVAPTHNPLSTLELNFTHARELALLPVPRGTRRVDSPEIAEIQRNRFGTLQAESPPGVLRYRVSLSEPRSTEPPPTAADSEIPADYQTVIGEIGAEIGLVGTTPDEQVQRIRDFFLERFKYSLYQQGRAGLRTPLAHFLRESRRGHCEYFASATVLLLREAGIPARYAVGYVVENYSEFERAYIARARHAHAWALAYVDGEWQIVDSTPSVWYELEEFNASSWQTVQDLASWLWYRYQRVMLADWSDWTGKLIWLVPPLAIALYLRLRRSPLAVHDTTVAEADTAGKGSSPIAPLLDRLALAGLRPRPGETLKTFLHRATPPIAGEVSRAQMLRDYDRARYGPHRFNPDAERDLARQISRFSEGLGGHAS